MLYLQYVYICINKHGKALSSISARPPSAFYSSPYARRFSEQTDKKNPCWAVFSIIFKMADTTNTCVLPTRLVSCTDFRVHEQDTRRRCYVTYHIVYPIVTTVSEHVSYRGKCNVAGLNVVCGVLVGTLNLTFNHWIESILFQNWTKFSIFIYHPLFFKGWVLFQWVKR